MCLLILTSEELRDVSAREHVIDIHKEPFIRDLPICHEKGVWSTGLHCGLLVELLSSHNTKPDCILQRSCTASPTFENMDSRKHNSETDPGMMARQVRSTVNHAGVLQG